MYRFLIILLFGFSTIICAYSATQTNWSEGPGVPGPVELWENSFYQSTDIDWSSIAGILKLKLIAKRIVDGTLDNPYSVYSEDIDGDGNMDILGAVYADDDIIWWENADGSGSSWIEHTIDGEFDGARDVYSEDIDGDGDMDILGAALGDTEITWWENADGSGSSWVEHLVDGNYWTPGFITSADIDGDGDMDILSLSYTSDIITWWQNSDGSGTSWVEYTIAENFDGPFSICTQDIDGDGDIDVIGEAGSDHLTWWENSDTSPGIYWTEHIVDDTFVGYYTVYSEDIDGDCDMDILGAGALKVVWWENIDATGTAWDMHIVDEDFNIARCLYSCDIDADGDMDILGAADNDDSITWWENADSHGLSWIEHIIDDGFNSATSVYSEDINGDGYLDVIGAAWSGNTIAWWDLIGYAPGGRLESSVLYTQWDPDWDYLEWNSQTPSGTAVSFQVRASDDHTAMGAWSDTLNSPCSLTGILNDGDTYVQYRAILETSNPDSTPALIDVTISWNPVGIGEISELIPSGTTLLPITPNPTAGSPVIRFGLSENAFVDISIFDLSGRLVSEIHGDEYSMGFHDVLIGVLSPGIYFCRMISGDFTATQRFVVIK